MTAELFKAEITEAIKAYDRHVVCLEKPLEEMQSIVASLMEKAIKAYVERAPGLRHGIALDRHLTVVLSQTAGERPLCAIYFNLSSPYNRQRVLRAANAEGS